MAATVGFNFTNIVFPTRHVAMGPYKASNGTIWMFGRNSGTVGSVRPLKATDPMVDFSIGAGNVLPISSAGSVAIEAMAQYQVGDVVHIATQISTGAVYYNSYNMATDAWTLAVSENAVPAATQPPVTGSTFVSLVVRSNGNVVIVYNGGQTAMSSTFNMVYYRERTGTNTYGTATRVDNGGSVNWTAGPAMLGASDRVHIFLNNNTANDAHQRTLTSANVLETFPTAFDLTPYNGGIFIYGAGTRYVSGANTEVRVPYLDSGQVGSVAAMTSADAPSVSVQTGISGASIVALTNNLPRYVLAADATTTHALLTLTSDSDLHHKDDGGTGTWSADTNEHAGTVNAITANVYDRSGTKLAMVVDDAAVLKYAEISLAGAPAATSLAYDRYAVYRTLTLR